MNIFRPVASGADIATRERIREAVRVKLALAPDVTISITQLRCNEPDCPPIETVIAIMRPAAAVVTYKLHKPVTAIDQTDIDSLGEHDHGNIRS